MKKEAKRNAGKSKSNAPAAKSKSKVVAKTKTSAGTKNKVGVKSRGKVAPLKEKNDEGTKPPVRKIIRGSASGGRAKLRIKRAKPVAVKNTSFAAEQADNPVKQQVVRQVAHGQDQHFIPAHKKEVYMPVHDGKKSEKFFHNKEEVALRQENQKVKADMASRMGRKRIFRIPGS